MHHPGYQSCDTVLPRMLRLIKSAKKKAIKGWNYLTFAVPKKYVLYQKFPVLGQGLWLKFVFILAVYYPTSIQPQWHQVSNSR